MAYNIGMFQPIYRNYGISKSFTYKEVGIHYATLNAAAKRGLLVKNPNGTYQLTEKGIIFMTIENYAKGNDYISLRCPKHELGMLCSIKGMDIMDCYDEPWEYSAEVLVWNSELKDWGKIILKNN